MVNTTLEWQRKEEPGSLVRAVRTATWEQFAFAMTINQDYTAHLTVYQKPLVSGQSAVMHEDHYTDVFAAEHAAGRFVREHRRACAAGHSAQASAARAAQGRFRLLFISGEGPVEPERLLLWLGVAFGRYGERRYRGTVVCSDDTPADRYAAQLASDLGWETEVHRRSPRVTERQRRTDRDKRLVRGGADVCVSWPGMGGTSYCTRLVRDAGIPIMLLGDEEHKWRKAQGQP